MRIIMLAFVSFVLSGVFLLPVLNVPVHLPESYYIYAPVALMVIAILIQIDGIVSFKKILKARQIEAESDSLAVELRDVTEKLHQEKKLVTDLKSQLASQEKEARQLSQGSSQLKEQVKDLQKQKSDLQTAFDDALKRQKHSEAELQKLKLQKQFGGERDVLQMLALLQEKGRFVDFLMDDITQYPDAQIGAAARVVHQGCSKVIGEYFEIIPLSSEKEGTTVKIDETAYHPQEFRFLGKVGQAPFQGTILHRGWGAKKVKLPRLVSEEEAEKPLPSGIQVITPAEVELT